MAARTAIPASPHQHPVAVPASYLRAPAAGPTPLTVVPGPAGRTLAHSLVVLGDAGAPARTVQATTATLIAGGWVDEDHRIWDSTGRLVAQSRQLARAPR